MPLRCALHKGKFLTIHPSTQGSWPNCRKEKDNMWLEKHDCKENWLDVAFYPEPILKQSFVMIPRYLVNLQVLSFIRNCGNCWFRVCLVLVLMILHLHSFLKPLSVGWFLPYLISTAIVCCGISYLLYSDTYETIIY